RKVLRDRIQRRLCLAGAHAARARHPRRLRPAQEREREIVGARAARAARHGDDRLRLQRQSLTRMVQANPMDSVAPLILRFLLIPLGYFAAVVVATFGIVIRSRELAPAAVPAAPP